MKETQCAKNVLVVENGKIKRFKQVNHRKIKINPVPSKKFFKKARKLVSQENSRNKKARLKKDNLTKTLKEMVVVSNSVDKFDKDFIFNICLGIAKIFKESVDISNPNCIQGEINKLAASFTDTFVKDVSFRNLSSCQRDTLKTLRLTMEQEVVSKSEALDRIESCVKEYFLGTLSEYFQRQRSSNHLGEEEYFQRQRSSIHLGEEISFDKYKYIKEEMDEIFFNGLRKHLGLSKKNSLYSH